jgi:hypothetical protein
MKMPDATMSLPVHEAASSASIDARHKAPSTPSRLSCGDSPNFIETRIRLDYN